METGYNLFFLLMGWYEIDNPQIIRDLQEKSANRFENLSGGFKDTFVYRLGIVLVKGVILIGKGVGMCCQKIKEKTAR